MNMSFTMRSVDVLHVDDDADIREIIGTVVGSDPMFTVRSCASGEEALAATARWSPDLILLDFNMPGMDGPTTLTRLREQPQTAGVPVIYLTGATRAKELNDLRALGLAGIILKPFDPTTLRSQINAILCRSHRELESANTKLEEWAAIANAIIDSSEDAIVAKDLAGTILSWNAAAERLFQFRPEEVIGRSIRMHIPPEQLTHDDYILDQVRQGRSIDNLETRRLRKDGTAIDVSLRAMPIRSRNGTIIGASIVERDISKRKKIEAELNASERRYDQVVRGMSVGIWDWNVAADKLFWSDRLKEILQLPHDFVPSRREFEARLHPDERERVIHCLQRHISERVPYDIEYRLRRGDGSYVWLHATAQAVWDEHGSVVRVVGSVDDISKRKRIEEMFRLVVESAPTAMVMIDKSGQIALVNRQTERLFGYTSSELLGQKIELLMPAAERNQHQDRIGRYFVSPAVLDPSERAMAAGRELYGLRKDGAQFPVEIGLTPINTDDGVMVLGAVVDLTIRKQAEEERRQYNQRLEQEVTARTAELKALINAIPGMVAYWDKDLRCHFANTAYLEWFGWQPEQLVGVSMQSLLGDSLFAKNEPHIRTALTGQKQRFKRTLTKVDGSVGHTWANYTPHFNERGDVLGFFVLVTDVTPLWEAERRIEESEARYRMLAENSSDMIFRLDRDLIRRYVSPACRDILGYEERDITGKRPLSQIHPDDADKVKRTYDSLLDGHADNCTIVNRIRHQDGRWIWVEATMRALKEPSTGQVDGIVGALRDVSARQAIETKLEKRNMQLEAANKQLDDFAYAASHDLKAPLRVIDNASKWLEEDLAPHLTDETRENMLLLRSRVTRLEKLLDDLLQFSRVGRESGGSEIIAGSDLIDNVLALLPQHDGFEIDVGPGFGAIRVARMPLQQILMNLIGNAIKHHHKTTGRIEVTALDLGSYHAFAVKDDGPGIAAQFHDKIFGMFQTLKPRDQVEGSGMGLAIVRKQVEVAGGSLCLDSAEGKGSAFHFTLPAPDLPRSNND